MNKNFVTFVSGKLPEARVNAAFEGYLAYMQVTYPSQFNDAYFTMSYIQKYTGGHVMFSDLRLVNTLLGFDFGGTRKIRSPTLRFELDIPSIITTMEAEYATRSDKLKQELATNGMKQEALLEREDEWRSGKLSEEMSILMCEEEVLLSNLDLMTYYFELDTAALEAKHRLNQRNESKDDLELIAEAESERIVPINVMIHLPELETISFTSSRVKVFNTDTAYSRPAPSWITEDQVRSMYNRLLPEKDRSALYTINGIKTISPLVQRKSHGKEWIFKVQFLGNTPSQDLSYAMLTSTFITFEHATESVSVKFEPSGTNKFGGEQLWNSQHQSQPHNPRRTRR